MAQKRTLEDTQDERGSCRRWVRLHDDGGLEIGGQDIGPVVERFFGEREYEFARTVAAPDVSRLRELLELGPGDDLLDRLADRFGGEGGSDRLERFLQDKAITSRFWSRAGD